MSKGKLELFDVVIYHWNTRIIDSMPGKGMRKDTGFHNAEKRLETVLGRLNDDYSAAIVPAGKYKIGDALECGV